MGRYARTDRRMKEEIVQAAIITPIRAGREDAEA